MARKPPVHNPGEIYHVTLWGNAKQNIFTDTEDRHRLLLFLQEGMDRFGFRLHGYCLMSDHFHLAVQTGETSLSRIMQNLSLRYTKWINWRQDSIGQLFQGKYKAVIVEADDCLAQLVAFLHLNPLRSRIVENLTDYPWSSHCAYLRLEQAPWLTTELVLSRFSSEEEKARQLFHEFVEASANKGKQPELTI